mgnify:CR=1 FL=1
MNTLRPTILVVDTYRDMRTYLAHCLKPLAEVQVATSGYEALNILSHTHVDLVISELDLPTMPGHVLCKEMKVLYPDLLFVIMTSRSKYDNVRFMVEGSGYNALIYKPFEAVPFRRLIECLLIE